MKDMHISAGRGLQSRYNRWHVASPRRKRSVQRGTAANTRAEREHQVDAIVERGKRLKNRAEQLDTKSKRKTARPKKNVRRRPPS